MRLAQQKKPKDTKWNNERKEEITNGRKRVNGDEEKKKK
jgi:hypothetical protein